MLNRRHPSLEPYRAGQIVFRGTDLLNCYFRDVTQTGARLRLEKVVQLPPNFPLRFLSEGRTEVAELLWQNGHSVGVRFMPTG